MSTNTQTVAFTAVNVFDYLGDRPDAQKILDLIAEKAECFISCGADISEVSPDDLNFIVSMSAPWHAEDDGIGGYEFWGSRGCNHDYAAHLDEEEAFDLTLDETALSIAGLSASATSGAEPDYNLTCCVGRDDTGRATCDETVTFYVTDPLKFKRWASALLAAKFANAKAA